MGLAILGGQTCLGGAAHEGVTGWGQAGAWGHVLAEQTAAADAFQRPLVPRFRFQARLSGGVRH